MFTRITPSLLENLKNLSLIFYSKTSGTSSNALAMNPATSQNNKPKSTGYNSTPEIWSARRKLKPKQEKEPTNDRGGLQPVRPKKQRATSGIPSKHGTTLRTHTHTRRYTNAHKLFTKHTPCFCSTAR